MKILILDIETAPHVAYVWGLYPDGIPLERLKEPGYILCWSAKWYGDVQLSSYTKYNPEMLTILRDMLDEADVVVTYNGKRFDIPTVNAEFVAAGIKPPSGYKQVDLYQVVKKNFRFPSNKMEYVLKRLGCPPKRKHRGLQMWLDCMNGIPDAFIEMVDYNRDDVISAESLYITLLPWITNHPNQGLYADQKDVCPNCGGVHLERRGFAYTTMGKFQRYHCNTCGTWSRGKKSVAVKDVLVQEKN